MVFMAHIHHNYNHPTLVEKREQIVALWSSGTKQTQIAGVVGLLPQTVSTIVKHFLYGTYFVGKNEQFLPQKSLNLWNTVNNST